MADRKGRWLAPVLAVAVAACGGYAMGQEDPKSKEHPAGKEHPKGGAEHPKADAKASVSKEDLAMAVEAYVKKESEKSGGSFMIKDPMDNKDLALTLKKVHKDRLSQVGPDTYFACADFATADNTMYDLDIFMKGPNQDSLQTTEVSIHKKNGAERYSWYEDGGTWKKREMVAAGAHEHPKGKEHPQTKP